VATWLVGCDPPPPRVVFQVDSTAAGADAAPGDGVCATSGGQCTLLAAIDEANATDGGVDVVMPSGRYASVNTTVTGDVRLNPGNVSSVVPTSARLTVAAGGRLAVSGFDRSTAQGDAGSLALTVLGGASVVVGHSILMGLDVEAGASVVLNAVVAQDVVNAGTLMAVGSSFFGGDPLDTSIPVLTTSDGGTTTLRGSVVARPQLYYNEGTPIGIGGSGTCSGVPPTSVGFLFVEVGCGSVAQPGDGTGPARTRVDFTIDPFTFQITSQVVSMSPTSPLVDAIPLGDTGCDGSQVDLYGTPRGNDGDGDGVPGCDIGALELVP